jgi:hypothetical protein
MSRIFLDGRYQSNYASARRLVVVDGHERWVTQKVYDLTVALMARAGEWVFRDQLILDRRDRLEVTVWRLRREVGVRVENDRAGNYRILAECDCDLREGRMVIGP